MGIVKRGGGKPIIFVDLKGKPKEALDEEGKKYHGAFVASFPDKTSQVLHGGDALVGHITSIEVNDRELKDGTIAELRVTLDDPEAPERVRMQASLGQYVGTGDAREFVPSFHGAKLVALLNGVDLSQPVRMFAGAIMSGDKMPDGTPAERDLVWFSARQGERREDNSDRVVAKYADGSSDLGEQYVTSFRGKKAINPEGAELLHKTLQQLCVRLDEYTQGQRDHVAEDDGVSAEAVHAAANVASERQAMRG